jgi:3-oxoacid CoA-transferase subunit A
VSTELEESGPIDYVVVEFPGSRMTGEDLPLLVDLHETGIIRILDLAFVSRGLDGSVTAAETRDFDGREYVLERGIVGDFALVHAWKADGEGNLVFRRTARNFNPLAAMAGRITVAEVEELVPVGALPPDGIHTPGIFVQRVVVCRENVKRIERRTVRPA